MRISDWSSDVCSSDLSRISVDDADQSAAVRAGPEVARALCLPYGSAVAEPYPPAGAWMAAHDGRCDRGHPGCHAIDARREGAPHDDGFRSEEHTSELQSLMRISYAVFCLKKKK